MPIIRSRQKLAETAQNPPIFYRRIGNYSTFVFDANDEAAANSLLDQVIYEKEVRWLGEDPFALKRAERNFVLQTSDLFMNTFLAIVGGLGLSVVVGNYRRFCMFFICANKNALKWKLFPMPAE